MLLCQLPLFTANAKNAKEFTAKHDQHFCNYKFKTLLNPYHLKKRCSRGFVQSPNKNTCVWFMTRWNYKKNPKVQMKLNCRLIHVPSPRMFPIQTDINMILKNCTNSNFLGVEIIVLGKFMWKLRTASVKSKTISKGSTKIFQQFTDIYKHKSDLLSYVLHYFARKYQTQNWWSPELKPVLSYTVYAPGSWQLYMYFKIKFMNRAC